MLQRCNIRQIYLDTAEKQVKKEKNDGKKNHRPGKLTEGEIDGGDGADSQDLLAACGLGGAAVRQLPQRGGGEQEQGQGRHGGPPRLPP